jgi:hypothetical protein
MLFSKVQKAIRGFFGVKEETPAFDNHVHELVLELPESQPVVIPPPLLPLVSAAEFKLIRRLNTPAAVAKMLSNVVVQNRANGTHQEWTSKEYDALELIFKTLTLREDIALVKIAGVLAGSTLGVQSDSMVAQYAIQDAQVYTQVERIINQMRILEMTVNGRRLGCRGHIASSGGHRYLFVSFHVKQEAV